MIRRRLPLLLISGFVVLGLLAYARLHARSEVELRLADVWGGAGSGPSVEAVAVVRDGSAALSGTTDGTLRLWRAGSSREVAAIAGSGLVTDVAFAPGGSDLRALVGRAGGAVEWLDLASGKVLRTLKEQGVPRVAFLPDGKKALTGTDDDKTVTLWDLESGKALRRLTTAASTSYASDVIGPQLTALAVSRDGARALSANYLGGVSLWDLASGVEVANVKLREADSVAFAPDGKGFVASAGKFLHGSSLPDGRELWSIEDEGGPGRRCTPAAFSPDGEYAVAGCGGRRLKLWSLARRALVQTLDLPPGAEDARVVAFAADGGSIVVGTARGVVLRFLLGEAGR